MSLIQAVRLLDIQKVMEVNAPGDPRLWDVLNDTLGGITVQLMHCIGIEWNTAPDRVPGLDDWTDWLSLEGNLGVSLGNGSDAYCLQKRTKGFCNHPLEQLILDWMKIQGYPLPDRLWFSEQYVISGLGDTARIFESMRGLMGLGSKSGIWDENTEDCRLLAPNESMSWPYHYENALNLLSLNKNSFLESLNAESNLITSRYAITENTGRGTPTSMLAESPLELWRTFRQPSDDVSSTDASKRAVQTMATLGPEHFVVGLPKTAQFEKIGVYLKDFVQSGAALMDRSPGIIRYRESAGTILHLESFPNFCSKFEELNMAFARSSYLYSLSPWQSSNHPMNRRIESFLETAAGANILGTTIFSGSADWISILLQAFSNTTGWMMSESVALELLRWNEMKLLSSNLLLFWSELDPAAMAKYAECHGLSVIALGKPTDSGSFAVGQQTIPIVDIPIEEIRSGFAMNKLVSATWFYKDQKSPTYGFEKAAIFPDRFLKRITQVGVKGEIQKGISWGMASSPVHRDHLMKSKTSQPISYLRWSDGESHYVDAIASVDGVGDYDPKAMGEWACDLAYRGLVSKGVDTNSRIVAQAWLNNPLGTDQPEAEQRFGAFYLANQGLKAALESYGCYFGGVSFAGSFSRSRPFQQELVLRLRGKLPLNTIPVFPGFRMAGEVLFVLGPKPAFMDAGTRLLPHFKVISNHVTRLNVELQKELYSVIHSCIRNQMITVARPVGQSGTLGAILEMSLWGNIGAALRPGVSTIELFSGAPGRIVVGILPQEAERFKSLFRQELINHVGESAGDRIFGQPLSFYRDIEGSPNVSL